MPGTAKRKCEPSSSVASLNSGVHEQKPTDNAIQPLGGICHSFLIEFFFFPPRLMPAECYCFAE